MRDNQKRSLILHKKYQGKFAVSSKVSIKNNDDLSWAYSPGVAAPCLEIQKDKKHAYDYTSKGNMVGVITDGSAVLGLGNIGPDAAMPVMEGKAILFKEFANIDAIPLCLNTSSTEDFIKACVQLEPTLGGINLEDIAAPQCIEIERALKKRLHIPVFHDDQHGTAIVVSAALINGLKLIDKQMEDLSVLLVGTGAAGHAIARMLHQLGIRHIQAYNKDGAVTKNNSKDDISIQSLIDDAIIDVNVSEHATLDDLIKSKDVVIGVSVGNILSTSMIKSMNKDPLVFALANPTPEISPELAKDAGAKIIGTGRSDYPNQINNVLAFPGIFKGVLLNKIIDISDEIKAIAAYAIAETIEPTDLSVDYILPSPFDKRVVENIVNAITRHTENQK